MDTSSDTLQAADAETPEEDIEVDAPAVTEEPDSAPDEVKPEPKVEFTPEQQAVFDKVIGEKTFKAREAERKAQELEKRLQETEAKLPKATRPAVPDPPDPYDADYEQKVAARDEAVKAAAAYDARQSVLMEQQAEQQRQQERQAQESLVKSAESYAKRAAKLGLDTTSLQSAAETVVRYGISDDLTNFLLSDDKGPLLTSYLASNPVHLEALSSMSPIQVGAYIEASVKPNLATVRTRTQAPEPADVLDGGGSPPSERGPKGARFE